MLDVLKEYLVSLGFKVDSGSLNQAKSAMGTAEKVVSKFATTAVGQFAIAESGVTSFVATVDIAIAKLISGLAKTDLQMQMFARRMWTNQANAQAFKNSLGAMGANMEDLYVSPELMNNFLKLRNQSFQMAPPAEYETQMKYIRSILFEFQRLKLEATYALQWIGFYLIKYMKGPLEGIRVGMKDLNDYLVKTMPKWTEKIAQVLSWFVRLGVAAFKAGKGIVDIFNKIPTSVKVAAMAIMGISRILTMSPIGMWLTLIAALLLLLDDFYTYESGGESQFEGMWKWVDKLKEDLNKDGFFDNFIANLRDMGDLIAQIAKDFGDFLNDISQTAGFKDFADLLEKTIVAALRDVNDLLTRTIYGYKMLYDLMKNGGVNVDALEKEFNERISHIWKSYSDRVGYDAQPQSYVIPKSNRGNVSVTNNNESHFNIYGGDANSIASTVSTKMDSIHTRNFQGVLL